MLENDIENSAPSWREKMDNLSQRDLYKDMQASFLKEQYISTKEVALKHGDSLSTVKVAEDGTIDLFAGEALGIRIDPKTESVNIFADNINLIGKKVNIKTLHSGLVWNDHHFNPDFYLETSTEKDQYLSGTRNYWRYDEEEGWHWSRGSWSVKPMIKSQSSTSYSDGMIEIMKSMGLPVD